MSEAYRAALRDILLNDWDPHNAARVPAAAETYNLYIEPLAAFLGGGADEAQVVDWLHEREKESLCMPSLGTQRLNRIARKLIALQESFI